MLEPTYRSRCDCCAECGEPIPDRERGFTERRTSDNAVLRLLCELCGDRLIVRAAVEDWIRSSNVLRRPPVGRPPYPMEE